LKYEECLLLSAGLITERLWEIGVNNEKDLFPCKDKGESEHVNYGLWDCKAELPFDSKKEQSSISMHDVSSNYDDEIVRVCRSDNKVDEVIGTLCITDDRFA